MLELQLLLTSLLIDLKTNKLKLLQGINYTFIDSSTLNFKDMFFVSHICKEIKTMMSCNL